MELTAPDFLEHAARHGYTSTELTRCISNLYTASEDFPSSIVGHLTIVLAIEEDRLMSYMTTNYYVFRELAKAVPHVRADTLMKRITH